MDEATARTSARDMIRQHLLLHPRSQQLYLTDAAFYAALGPVEETLAAVLRVVETRWGAWSATGVVRDALALLLSDDLMERHESAQAERQLATYLLAREPSPGLAIGPVDR